MNRYKAIICDIDGTLTSHASKSLPSQRVKMAIKQAQEAEVLFCVATARSLQGAKHIIDFLDLRTYGILNNGATIYNLQTEQPTWGSYINPIDSNGILQLLKKLGKQIKVSTTNRLIENIQEVSTDMHIAKIAVFGLTTAETTSLKKEVATKFQTLQAVEALSGVGEHFFDVNVTNREATKQNAILKLSEIVNIQPKDMIGIGDSYNDFPLLMACGLKVAMGNALEDLKATADYIAPPVTEDGVANILEKYVLSHLNS